MVEILRVLQEAAIEVSGRGEEPLSPTTQETIMIRQFERYTIHIEMTVKADAAYAPNATIDSRKHVSG